MEIKVLLINENGADFVNVENTNEAIEHLLKWDDAWNVPTIQVRRHNYLVVCSDRGKLRHERVACLSYNNLIEPKKALQEPFIVGSVIITKFDGIDDFEALNDEDIEILKSRLYTHGKDYLKDYLPTILVLD